MKTNAIVRIVIYSIAIAILLGILSIGLLAGNFMFHFSDELVEEFTGYDQSDPEAMTIDLNGSVSAEAVRCICIEWISGSITVRPGDTDQITVSETEVDREDQKMRWKINGDTLNVQYCEDSIRFPSFGINIKVNKDLLITVPRDWTCEKLEIVTASARVDVNDMTIQEFEFDGASGICNIKNCNVDKLNLDTASGDVNFTGTLEILDCDAASANCSITVTNVPRSIDIDTASGDLEITLPDTCGFSCSHETLSGRFTTDFDTVHQNGRYVHGDGYCKIDLDAMSADIRIFKHECTTPDCTESTHNHSNHHS